MKRKYMVGYPLWNCVDMIPWLLDGARKLDPSRVHLHFLFSNCGRETMQNFRDNIGMIQNYRVTVSSTNCDLREGDNHNLLMAHLLASDCDVLLAPQDDNQFQNGRILDDLDAVFDKYGDRAGVVGMRDGYGYFYNGIIGQSWSNSTGVNYTRFLSEGEMAEVTLVNTGPFAYSRHTINTIGFNENMPLFSFEDYCLRCHFGGKVNILLGCTMKHEKFGRIRPADFGSPQSAEDLRRLNSKWEDRIGHKVHG